MVRQVQRRSVGSNGVQRKRRRRRSVKRWQRDLPFTARGGRRPGAGRPRGRTSVPHVTRAKLSPSYPVQITMKLRAGLPSLRRKHAYQALLGAFYAGGDRFGFRLNQYSVQSNHLHLIVEATDRTALTRGMQGLTIRIAKALNRTWGRKGKVFRERYHDRILRSPRQVRNALRYVLNNVRKHSAGFKPGTIDTCSSGAWFTGWRESFELTRIERTIARPVARAKTWLLHTGWLKYHPPISVNEAPARP